MRSRFTHGAKFSEINPSGHICDTKYIFRDNIMFMVNIPFNPSYPQATPRLPLAIPKLHPTYFPPYRLPFATKNYPCNHNRNVLYLISNVIQMIRNVIQIIRNVTQVIGNLIQIIWNVIHGIRNVIMHQAQIYGL